MNAPRWHLAEHADLSDRNTFHVAVHAPLLLEVIDPSALPDALALPQVAGRPLLALGGGSNLLFAADPEGVVLSLGNRDTAIVGHHLDHVIVRAGAGAPWHALVMWSLEQGLSGLENLALIPGTAGAAPIQNIGAYGAQVGEFVHAIDAWDTHARAWARFDNEACRFGYRDSVFKQHPGRWLITAIELRLPYLHELRLDYAGIREELAARGVATPSARDVADAVIAIRTRKLPDPAVLGNAGSFFKNPQLPAAQADALHQRFPALPQYPGEADGLRKLSAGWMIEACGWKGHRDGDAGVAPGHALVLVNHGHASGAEVLALARRISASVQEHFGVSIEPEPNLIGARW